MIYDENIAFGGKKMNIVVIGLGSMGKRRVRLLRQYTEMEKKRDWHIIGIDSNGERCTECENLHGIETFSSLEEAGVKYKLDAAVISTSPLTHAKIIEKCLKEGLHVFTELNLVDTGYESNLLLAQEKEKTLFLSSTFLYRKEIQYIKEKVKQINFGGMYRYHIGQYLPTWHPWENYKNFFVGNKETNACREILAIELPWLIECFGKIKGFYSTHRKVSGLDIDYDDSYQIILEHESGVVGCLTADIVTPKTGRELELWQEKFCITWKGTPDTLMEYDADRDTMQEVFVYEKVDHQSGYNQFIIENAYYDELVNYIQTIQGKARPKYSFESDRDILKLIDKIEA